MTHAKGFTFPSRYEGFGFPILEAMSCGTPVLTSNISAMEEYIKNKEAILVSPENVVEISSGIKKILVDPEFCENMANRANQLWPKFNWDKTSEEILKLI